MEHVNYELVSFFIRRDEGEILDFLNDVGLTVEKAVRMSASSEDIVIEAT